MKSTLRVLFFLVSGLAMQIASAENPLEIWTREFQRSAIGKTCPVVVTAKLQARRGQPTLVFDVINVTKQVLHVCPSELPWSRTNPLRIVAVTTEGKRISNEYPISDPPLSEDLATLAPGQTLRGEIPLSQTNLMTDKLPKDQDTIVLWLYSFSDTTPTRYAPCSGVVVMPRSK